VHFVPSISLIFFSPHCCRCDQVDILGDLSFLFFLSVLSVCFRLRFAHVHFILHIFTCKSPCCCSNLSFHRRGYVKPVRSFGRSLGVLATLFVFVPISSFVKYSTDSSTPLVALFLPLPRKICSLIGPDYLPSVSYGPLLRSDSTFARI